MQAVIIYKSNIYSQDLDISLYQMFESCFLCLTFFSEIEAMKKQMEEEIRAQLMANQEAMSDMDWDSRVRQMMRLLW